MLNQQEPEQKEENFQTLKKIEIKSIEGNIHKRRFYYKTSK
jgi:hypothetical protein